VIRRVTAPLQFKRGVLISRPPDSDKVIECELIQCCHCQYSKPFAVGDELRWGYCGRCHNFHCPKPECLNCVPIRQWLENMHAGRDPYHRPIVGRVEAEVPG